MASHGGRGRVGANGRSCIFISSAASMVDIGVLWVINQLPAKAGRYKRVDLFAQTSLGANVAGQQYIQRYSPTGLTVLEVVSA